MLTSRTSTALVALALTALALTGCSVGFTPAGGGDAVQPQPVPSAPQEAPADAPADESKAASVRDQFAGAASSVTCPDGALTIDRPATVVHVIGACDQLTVTGAGAVVLADIVGTLTVGAATAMVSVDDVASIVVTDQSVSVLVEWAQGQPSIEDDGVLTVVNQVVN